MNWIKENKFLTGFFAVMLIGIGVLGYFVFSASSAYDAADDNYRDKANELNRLRHLPLYPNTKNLKALEAQKTEAAALVSAFQAQLAAKEFPAEDLTPQEFQDKLKKDVTDIVEKAAAANMELPQDKKFYLGFDPYESRPPEKEAVGPLTKQLQAIKWVVEKLIEAKISRLVSLTRVPLAEEKSLAASSSNRRAERQERSNTELVSRYPFDLELVSKQKNIAEALNVIVGPTARQFYIPRVVRFKNQKTKGPERVSAGGASATAGQPPAASLGYILGEELVETSLRLEIVEFAPPNEGAAGKSKASK